MTKIFLSIGSNLDPEHHIPVAIEDLEKEFGPLEISSLYESDAVGFEGPSFLNLVAAFDSSLSAETIAAKLRSLEERHGRTRESRKFSSRTLDIDLILYGDHSIQTGGLEIPRPEITRYAFVLEPLAEIAPDLLDPVSGKSYGSLWATFDRTTVRQHKIARLIPD
jgi:2-amino-4-hydroxy-6-hydroxymethyldihydropteridine diphosphokinase